MATKPDPEVRATTSRRRFTAEYKRRILAEADACKKTGELGALLRREGLYSSHLANWRSARQANGQAGLEAHQRGPKQKPRADDKDRKIAQLEKELAKAKARAEQAEYLVEMQKKMAEILGRTSKESDKT